MAVLVVNGGNRDGAAGRMTDLLSRNGFDPLPPGNAVVKVPATVIWYAPGRAAWAEEVNAVVDAPPGAIRAASRTTTDENWVRFGEGLDVLVVIGPVS